MHEAPRNEGPVVGRRKAIKRKEDLMRRLLLIASVLGALTLASAAEAVPPIHDTVSFHDQFVDTTMCGFPIVGDLVFTNDITEFRDGEGTNSKLQLHQSTVGTFTANGVTLRINSRETIMVDFVDGVPVTAKHVGQLDHIRGPNGPIFHRTGQDVFQVVFDPQTGFYVDGPRIARHGLRDDFDLAVFCGEFGE
jgi:hypothetical protein